MDDCAAILALAADAAGAKQFSFRGHSIDPFAAPERVTVAEAFARHAGLDLWRCCRRSLPRALRPPPARRDSHR